VIQNGTVPIVKPGFFGKIDTSGKPMSWWDRFNQDKIILLELLPDFCIANKLDLLPPVVDELSRGLREMVKTKEVPIWLVLGCQLYLDIYHVTNLHPLGTIDMAHKELQRMGVYVTHTLQSYAKYTEKLSTEN
jgi:hypothetical protein